MRLKALVCVVVVGVVGAGLAVDEGFARGWVGRVVRVRDRVVSVVGSGSSGSAGRGLVRVSVVVRVRSVGRGAVGVFASDFVVSAQGDVFSARAWHGAVGGVRVGSGRSRVVRLVFGLPRAAVGRAVLVYRPAGGGFGGVPLGGAPRVAGRAGPSSTAPMGGMGVSTFDLSGGVGDPWGTAVDSGGNVWFAEPGCDFAPTCSAGAGPGQIGELRAGSRTIVFYPLPNLAGNQPIFLAFDGSGKLWFTTPNNSMIGEFDPTNGQFLGQWPVTAGSGPWDLTFAAGALWYTEHLASAIGSFDPSTHTHRDFQTPSPSSNPYGIAATGTRVWFTENNSSIDRVAALDTTTNAISEYPIIQPTSGTPHLLTIGPGGHPWWTEGWSNTIATLNPATATPGQCGANTGTCQGIQRYQPPPPTTCTTSGAHTSGITYQPSSNLLWLDNSLTAQIGSFNPSSNTFALNTLSNCNAHPHDGLSLDNAAGNLWFDEEFANAIGELPAPAPAPGGTAPTVVTGSSSAVGTTSAMVAGSVNPNGQATTYHFDYGTSTGYGSQAPAPPDPSAGSGTTSQAVSANLTGLSPATTYHYRLVATNPTGTQYSTDQSFTTATPTTPPSTGPSPPSTGPNPAPSTGSSPPSGAPTPASTGPSPSSTGRRPPHTGPSPTSAGTGAGVTSSGWTQVRRRRPHSNARRPPKRRARRHRSPPPSQRRRPA